MKKILIPLINTAVVLSAFYLCLTTEAQQADLASIYVVGSLPITNPNSHLWSKAVEYKVPMGGQTVIEPMKPEPSVPHINIRSLNNGTNIAFLLTWPDPTKNDRAVKIDEFRDSAAVLIAPVGQAALLAMGTATQPVNVLHWRADWQADIEEGFQDLQSAYPNLWVDFYPNAIGEPPYSLPEAFPEAAQLYLPGWHVGNPLSQPLKVTPVEELDAKGYGSLATQLHQDAIGWGVWEDGWWNVVIARRMDTRDASDIEIVSGSKYSVAFAVWDGASGDIGSRKSVSALLTILIKG